MYDLKNIGSKNNKPKKRGCLWGSMKKEKTERNHIVIKSKDKTAKI